MRIPRYLKEDSIDLHFCDDLVLPEPPEGEEELTEKQVESVKEQILDRLVDLFDPSKISNRTRLLQDMIHRERKASTAVGHGIAIPHVRTMQARGFALAFGISPRGLPFDEPDYERVRIFLGMIAPPYDDKVYLKAYQQIGKIFGRPSAAEDILAIEEPGEVIRYLQECLEGYPG